MLKQRSGPAYPAGGAGGPVRQPVSGADLLESLPMLPPRIPVRPSRPRAGARALALIAIALAAVLAACETPPTPVLRGSGSEHRQSIRVGLPF